MWQPDFDHPTWTSLTINLLVGAQFTHQLAPKFTNDVFLHRTVEAVNATVQTDRGTFDTAARMGYVIDYGWSTPQPTPPAGPNVVPGRVAKVVSAP